MADQERELTGAEQARKEAFERTRAAYEAQGYRYRPLVISVIAANVGAVALALPLDILLGIGFFLLHPEGGGTFDLLGMLLVLVAFLALIVVHELIHGLVWGICAKRHWKAVSFGVIWKYLTPYCTCDEPLSRRAYVAGALAPTIVLGLVPVAVAYVTGSILWLGIGLLMILGGGGDLAIVLKMLRFKPDGADVLYLDHPYECGLVAFVR